MSFRDKVDVLVKSREVLVAWEISSETRCYRWTEWLQHAGQRKGTKLNFVVQAAATGGYSSLHASTVCAGYILLQAPNRIQSAGCAPNSCRRH